MLRPPEVVEEFGYTNELVTGSRTMLSMIVDAESMSMHASDFRRKNAGGGLNFAFENSELKSIVHERSDGALRVSRTRAARGQVPFADRSSLNACDPLSPP